MTRLYTRLYCFICDRLAAVCYWLACRIEPDTERDDERPDRAPISYDGDGVERMRGEDFLT